VLYLARQWPRLAQAQRAREWAPLIAGDLPRDLQGQTAVIVGWGPVGQEIGRLLQAIGLDLLVVRRESRPDSARESTGTRTITSAQLNEVLPGADWLMLACPLTAQTRGMIGAAQLALLPAHAGVVNVSRGEVVDEAALVDALRRQKISGAYLDVFATEPLAPDSPLWDLKNVVVTPHSAGFSDGNERRVARLFLENLDRWRRGDALVNAVAAAPPPTR
jgi:phosphoglycerate dehydrogenase-like enzyme